MNKIISTIKEYNGTGAFMSPARHGQNPRRSLRSGGGSFANDEDEMDVMPTNSDYMAPTRKEETAEDKKLRFQRMQHLLNNDEDSDSE